MVNKYLTNIADTEQKSKTSEYTHRTALENLFNEIKNNNSIQIHQESRDNNTADKPDFRVSRNSITLGYVETKKIGVKKLEKEINSKQLDRYYALSDNILLTNYLRFIWIYNKEVKADVILCEKIDLTKSIKLNETKVRELTEILEKFFNQNVKPICNATELAQKLAIPTKYIKDSLLNRLKGENEKLVSLHKLFKENINSELTADEFADAFAQTMTYSMFLARLNTNEQLTVDNLKRLMPTSFMLIKELLGFLSDIHLFKEISPYLDRILFVINNINLEEVNKSLQINKTSDNDPYIHFYEDFLNAYDKEKKELSGSYYTPRPVVQGITNIIDKILSSDFDLDAGFGNTNVRVLDFACGTGTFLYEIFDKILSRVSAPAKKALIENHLLKNMFGFEFMMAPYSVSHLKLSSFLQEHGKELKNEDERINVYFTNTLDDINIDKNRTFDGIFPAIAKEGKTAQAIKEDESILVITGNPPYNNSSKNNLKGDLQQFHNSYKPSNEQKLNLDDDYIKFIAFAHNKIEKAGKGVVGVITNNSFYRGITHRRMRGKLLKTFDKIYIIDLHGSGGKQDENVFDIEQEVGITIMVKNDKIPEVERGVFYCELLGSRAEKFKQLANIDFKTIPKLKIDEFNQRFNNTRWSERFEYKDLTKLNKKGNLNFFYPIHKNKVIEEYAEFVGLTEIFEEYCSGIQTKADNLAISFSKKEVIEKINLIQNGTQEEILSLADKTKDGRDWTVEKAKADVADYNEDNIKLINYRPFDTRYTYYTGRAGLIAYPRYDIMQHIVNNNIGLVFPRINENNKFDDIIVTTILIDLHLTGSNSYIAPLYTYLETSKRHLNFNEPPKPNFKDSFLKYYKKNYPNATHQQVFAYVYAILYCPTYRNKYIDLLKIDFPRIPFNFSLAKMEKLALLGQQLINIHLLKDIPNISIGVAKFYTEPDYICTTPTYDITTCQVFVNKSLCFTGVTQEVWDFKIGGYQVIDKYLKSRKGLDIANDIDHIEKMIKIIAETIVIMGKIDIAYTSN